MDERPRTCYTWNSAPPKNIANETTQYVHFQTQYSGCKKAGSFRAHLSSDDRSINLLIRSSEQSRSREAVHLLCHCHLSFLNRTTPLLVYDINDKKSHTNRTSYMQYGLKKTTTGLHFCICVVLSSMLNKLWIFMLYFSKQYGFNTGSVISCGWIVSYFYRQYGSFHRKFISHSFACVILM